MHRDDREGYYHSLFFMRFECDPILGVFINSIPIQLAIQGFIGVWYFADGGK